MGEPQQVEHELDRVAGSVRAHVPDPVRVAHRFQHRPGGEIVRLGAADEDLQRSRSRAGGHAAHRRVDHADPARLGPLPHQISHGWHAGRHVCPDGTGFEPVEQAVLAKQDRLDLTRTRQAGEHDVAAFGRVPCGVGPAGASGDKFRARLRPNVVHDQVVAGGEHVAAHRPAHLPEADEPDSHGEILSNRSQPGYSQFVDDRA